MPCHVLAAYRSGKNNYQSSLDSLARGVRQMVDISADKLAQRAFDVGLLDNQQLEMTWSELGTREVTADEFIAVATRRELLTKFQIDRLVNSERFGYFYGDY